MINKLAKAQKSWIAKSILILTALSFMSLFGVTGYIDSAGSNRTVIKVDDIEISQAQFSHLTQKELLEAKKMLGDDVEITEEMQTALIYEQVQKTLQDAILDRTAQKYHVAFRPELIRAFIINQPAFHDASGNFSRTMFNRMLSDRGLTEGDVISGIKRDLTRRLFVEHPVAGFNLPQPLLKALSEADNRRRTFKYIEIDPLATSVDRQISQEEIEQYYEDFGSGFIEPERRDVSVIYIPMEKIADNMQISDDDVKLVYDENKRNYETPQTRFLLQMMFENEADAKAAYEQLQQGVDFYSVAEQKANQSKEDTELGYVAEDEIVLELADEAFKLNIGGYTKPIQIGESWQILKVTDIKEGSVVPYEEAAAQIRAQLKEEGVYDEMSKLISETEDRLGAGTSLEDIAKEMELSTFVVKGLNEDGQALFVTPNLKDVITGTDFIDTAFSYALGETSQVIETDNGLAIIRIDNIIPAHQKPITDVQAEIQALWAQNEKTAIVQELINDVMHDLENDGDLSEIGKRYNLDVYRSQPITRNETFANISYADIREMFADPLDTPKQLQQGNKYIIVVADNEYKNSIPLSETEQKLIRFNAMQSLMRDFSAAMLSSYADDYKIRIKYKLLGIED